MCRGSDFVEIVVCGFGFVCIFVFLKNYELFFYFKGEFFVCFRVFSISIGLVY